MDRAPHHRDFFSLFLSQTARRPGARALQWQDGTWTYSALLHRVEAYAAALSEQGVGSGDQILISLHRSPDTVAALLAILRLRAAYVPLQPNASQEQRIDLLAKFAPKIILAERATQKAFSDGGVSVMVLENLPQSKPQGVRLPVYSPSGSDLICVLSLSSDGAKRQSFKREALNHSIQWQMAESRVGPGERTLQFMPLNSEISFQEIFVTLCAGGALVLMDDENAVDSRSFAAFLYEEKIQRLFLSSQHLEMVAEAALENHLLPPTLREVIITDGSSGESSHVRKFFAALPSHSRCKLLDLQWSPESHHSLAAQPE